MLIPSVAELGYTSRSERVLHAAGASQSHSRFITSPRGGQSTKKLVKEKRTTSFKEKSKEPAEMKGCVDVLHQLLMAGRVELEYIG